VENKKRLRNRKFLAYDGIGWAYVDKGRDIGRHGKKAFHVGI
jgi:hypothetical protein